jgi:hyaluronoglucosaminidase
VNAGVIEGFFGRPWDWSARLSGLDFLRDFGYQFYVYAPKADPYLRRRWREPLPDQTLQQLSNLSIRGAENGISIGVGLTPFEIYLNYDDEAKAALRAKVLQINETHATVLCILFDDMRGNVENLPTLQASVVEDICAWSTARHFLVCPTYYSYDSRLQREFGPPPQAYLRDLGQLIDPRIDIFWTGEQVISQSYSAEHLVKVASDLKRKPFIWDNSISNDSRVRTEHLYLEPAKGWSLPADLVAGLAMNPMNQAHLSRISLCRLRQLLETDKTSIDCLRALCGPTLARQFVAYAELLRNSSLNQMGTTMRDELLTRFESADDSPYAQEVAAWLRNEYVFDPQCLTA